MRRKLIKSDWMLYEDCLGLTLCEDVKLEFKLSENKPKEDDYGFFIDTDFHYEKSDPNDKEKLWVRMSIENTNGDYYTYIQEGLDNNTSEDVRLAYGITKKEWHTLEKDGKIHVRYKNRTPYTNQLIPKEDILSKYLSKPNKIKEFQPSNPEEWIINETKIRNELKESHSANIGAILYELEKLTLRLKEEIKGQAKQNFMLTLLKKYEEDRNYIGFLAEERYGKYDIPNNIQGYMDSDILLSYISSKYGLVKALEVKKILQIR